MIGKDLLELRKMRRMSRQELSEKARVSIATIHRIENEAGYSPSIDAVERILGALGFELVIIKKRNVEGCCLGI